MDPLKRTRVPYVASANPSAALQFGRMNQAIGVATALALLALALLTLVYMAAQAARGRARRTTAAAEGTRGYRAAADSCVVFTDANDFFANRRLGGLSRAAVVGSLAEWLLRLTVAPQPDCLPPAPKQPDCAAPSSRSFH